MSNNKKIMITCIILAITFIAGGYIALDWFRFYHRPLKLEFLEAPFTPYMKVFVSFLTFVLVWITGKDRCNDEDIKKLKLIFTFIFLADMSFLLGIEMLGTAIFAICQVLLIHRNGYGIKGFIIKKEWLNYKPALIKYTIISLLIGLLALIFVFNTVSTGNILFYAFIIYCILLCTSFWIAWVSRLIKKLPPSNTLLIAIGMTFFLLCDLTVGTNMILKLLEKTTKTEFYWMISSSLTWMFYTPAIILLAFSGYNISNTKSYKKRMIR